MRTREDLDESLGLEPSVSLRSLHERVLREDIGTRSAAVRLARSAAGWRCQRPAPRSSIKVLVAGRARSVTADTTFRMQAFSREFPLNPATSVNEMARRISVINLTSINPRSPNVTPFQKNPRNPRGRGLPRRPRQWRLRRSRLAIGGALHHAVAGERRNPWHANLNADETIDAQACAELLHCSTEKVEDLAGSGSCRQSSSAAAGSSCGLTCSPTWRSALARKRCGDGRSACRRRNRRC